MFWTPPASNFSGGVPIIRSVANYGINQPAELGVVTAFVSRTPYAGVLEVCRNYVAPV